MLAIAIHPQMSIRQSRISTPRSIHSSSNQTKIKFKRINTITDFLDEELGSLKESQSSLNCKLMKLNIIYPIKNIVTGLLYLNLIFSLLTYMNATKNTEFKFKYAAVSCVLLLGYLYFDQKYFSLNTLDSQFDDISRNLRETEKKIKLLKFSIALFNRAKHLDINLASEDLAFNLFNNPTLLDNRHRYLDVEIKFNTIDTIYKNFKSRFSRRKPSISTRSGIFYKHIDIVNELSKNDFKLIFTNNSDENLDDLILEDIIDSLNL